MCLGSYGLTVLEIISPCKSPCARFRLYYHYGLKLEISQGESEVSVGKKQDIL